MKQTAISLIALSIAAMPAIAETTSIDTGSFDSIDVNGAISVIYEQGENQSVVVEQAAGDFSDIDVSTRGNELRITRKSLKKKGVFNRGVSINRSNGNLVVKVNGKVVPNYTVRISSPAITAIDASQSSTVTARDINTEILELDASSSADIIASGRAGELFIGASSSADVDAAGLESNSLDIDASSSAEVTATSNGLGPVFVNISSSAEAEIELAGRAHVDIDASSSADVELAGTCDRIIVDASSSADVEAEELQCNRAEVSASSSSDVNVHVSESITGHVSSGADLNVLGSPANRDVSRSSRGDVSFSG